MGWMLPSTGMWRGEVFAISDCLVETCNDHGLNGYYNFCVYYIYVNLLYHIRSFYITTTLAYTISTIWHILSLRHVHLNKLLILGSSYITCNLRKFVVWIKCSCTPKWSFALCVFIYSVWLFYYNLVHFPLYIHITDMALVNANIFEIVCCQ